MDAGDLEVVEQLDGLLAKRVCLVALAHAAQQLDLVDGRLRVVLRALHHLERHEPLPAVTNAMVCKVSRWSQYVKYIDSIYV